MKPHACRFFEGPLGLLHVLGTSDMIIYGEETFYPASFWLQILVYSNLLHLLVISGNGGLHRPILVHMSSILFWDIMVPNIE